MSELRCTFPERDAVVDVIVQGGLIDAPPGEPLAARGVLVTEASVLEALGGRAERLVEALVEAPSEPLVLPEGAGSKEADQVPGLWRACAAREMDRESLVVAVGGGTLLDRAGFLAGTWQRGLAWVAVPTTLLAQVDACLGGKTACDLDGVRNQVGVFHHPRTVLVDPEVLCDLPESVWRSGLGELAKTALLAGDPLFTTLTDGGVPRAGPGLASLVEACLAFKAGVVGGDPRETDRRRILNLGHTVGHVLEALALREGRVLDHGLAVAAGLRAETQMMGAPSTLDLVDALLGRLGLGLRADVEWDSLTAEDALARDKKRTGGDVIVPVLDAPGRVDLRPVGHATLLAAVRAACGA